MKKPIALLLPLSLLLGTSLSINAAEDSVLQLYLGGARYHFDSDRHLEDTNSLEIGAEARLTDEISMEAWLSSFDADINKTSTELDGMRYSAGALYHFSQDSLRPFIALGIAHNQIDDLLNNEHEETMGYASLGVKNHINERFVVRAEALALNSFDNELTDVGVRIAIGYGFGGGSTKPLGESYGSQSQDKQITTKEVDTAMHEDSPAAKPVAVVEADSDSDNDGVSDTKDQCPNTPHSLKVDDQGCPVMATKEVSINLNVAFKSNSSNIDENSLKEIQKVANFMTQFKSTSVTVEGHTDNTGSDSLNKRLSQKRADAVAAALVSQFGIDQDRVQAIGFGEENPIADNATQEGRAKNRRVIAVVKAMVKEAVTK